jgi:sulfite exporter TauE/SafE
VLGALGTVVNVAGRAAGLQQVVAVLAGALMIAMGLGASGLLPWARRAEGRLSGKLVGGARWLLAGRGAVRTYAFGLVLGLLPCGLSWTAFVGAAATGDPASGALFALAFGLGTAPALLLVGSATAMPSVRVRGRLHRAGGAAVALLGLLFLLRGLGVHAL